MGLRLLPTAAATEPVVIVGIVSAARLDQFGSARRGAVYVPFAPGYRSNVHLHVRPGEYLVDQPRRGNGTSRSGPRRDSRQAKSYAVSRRTREIGVRLAVGATPGRVRRMILIEGLRVGGVGVALGSVLALGVGRTLDAVLVEGKAFDWAVYTVTPALLLLAACVAAAWLPARRATAVDPSPALRSD